MSSETVDQTADKAQHDELAAVGRALLDGGVGSDPLGSLLQVINDQLEVALLATTEVVRAGGVGEDLETHIDRLCHLSKAAVGLHQKRRGFPAPGGEG